MYLERVKAALRALRNHKFISGAALYVFGNILQKASAFLLIPLYARYLSLDDFGLTGIVQSFGQVLTIALALGINSAVQRYYYKYYQDALALKRYVSSTFLSLITGTSVVTLVLFVSGRIVWDRFVHQVPFSPYVQLILVSVWGDTLVQYALYLYRAQQNALRFILTQLGQFLLTVIATIVCVAYLQMGARGQLLGLLIGSVVTGVVSTALILREYFTFDLNWAFVRESMVYGLPLIPHLTAQWVKGSLDRFFLESYTTLGEVGLYNFGYKLGLVMYVLVSSTNQAYVPYFFEMMKTHPNPKERLRKMVALYITGFGSICVALILFIGEIIQFLAPETYHGSADVARLLLFGFLINGYYFLAVNPLYYFKKTTWIPWLTGLSALVSVGLNLLLIPRLGATGAAWSFIVSVMVTLLLTLLADRRIWRVKLPYRRYLLLNVVIFAITLWMVYGVGEQVNWATAGWKFMVFVGYLLLDCFVFRASLVYFSRRLLNFFTRVKTT